MSGALSGLRVIEAGEGKALAYAGKLLRGLGAEVIKVEPPGGDALRAYGPFPGDDPNPEHSGIFMYMNGGKRGARLDLEGPQGREALASLLEDADALLHSFRPEEAQRLGLTPDDLLASSRHRGCSHPPARPRRVNRHSGLRGSRTDVRPRLRR